MIALIALIVLAVALIGYVISTYNFFQTTKVRIDASIQEIVGANYITN